jgi:Sugar-transfer associated ATP-grasp
MSRANPKWANWRSVTVAFAGGRERTATLPKGSPRTTSGGRFGPIREFLRLSRKRANEGHRSVLRQVLELSVLLPFYGVGPGYYQMAGFWDRKVRWTDKTCHMSAAAYHKIVERLNPRPYQKLSQNKLGEQALLRLFGVPCSELLGFYHALSGRTVNGDPLRTPEELSRFLAGGLDQSKICFKPVEGWGGRGFQVVEVVRRGNTVRIRRIGERNLIDVAEFCEIVLHVLHHGSSILEGYLEQHPAMARFNPSSVNTLRFWVLQATASAFPQVVLCYLRIGRAGSLVDNHSSGGIVAPVDLETGRVHAAIDGLPERDVFPFHPDHGAPIEGQEIPFFAESLELARRSLLAFPFFRFAGVDIAVTAQGPRVIELNPSPDRAGITRVPNGAMAFRLAVSR